MPREPYPRPRHPDDGVHISSSPKQIIFRHPGYAPHARTLLILPACDQGDTIDHEIARIACAIVACNEFDGFLTTDVLGERRVEGAQLPFLNEGYFFHVPGRESGYSAPLRDHSDKLRSRASLPSLPFLSALVAPHG